MLIYKDGIVADYRSIFTGTSFPSNGPSDEFLVENNSVKVNVYLQHDSETERLVSCEPYVQDGWAYTVRVEQKTPEEIAEQIQAQEAARKLLVEQQRSEAYRTESDPLFFKAQRGEATMEEWLAKVAEIKARYQ